MAFQNLLKPVTRRSIELMAADIFLVASSLAGAVMLRFEFWPAQGEWHRFAVLLPVLLGARLVSLSIFGLHKWSFKLCGLPEAVDTPFREGLKKTIDWYVANREKGTV